MIELEIKKINFPKSYDYFFTRDSKYLKKDCNINTYIRFVINNRIQMMNNMDDFVFVSGLIVGEYDNKKVCAQHSWIEYKGEVIDPTVIANLKELNCDIKYDTDACMKQLTDLFVKAYTYIPYIKTRYVDYGTKMEELNKRYGDDVNKYSDAASSYYKSLYEKVFDDRNFIKKVENKFNCKFVDDEGWFSIFKLWITSK